jgi:RND family efflux transporter MFP subunit
MVVSAGDEPHIRIFPGRVEASRRVELAFQVPGLLVEFPVKEGDKVAEGAVIGQLRQEEYQARLTTVLGQRDQALAALAALRAGERPEERLRREADVRAAQARLANARSSYDRQSLLKSQNATSRNDFERAETQYQVAQEDYAAAIQILELGTIGREEDIAAREAEVRALEGRVVEANLQLADTTLRAPYDGVIAQRLVEEQQNVQAKQPVVRFQDIDEIEIIVDVPESVMIADIRTADILEMQAAFSAAPGLEFPVHIREIAQVADPTTQTFAVRAAMLAPPGITARSGMTATVTVTYRRASILGNRILVPIAAVVERGPEDRIAWVVGEDGKVAGRSVKVGEATGNRIEIVDGLHPGDRIAVAGASHLREGMQVRDLGDALGSISP